MSEMEAFVYDNYTMVFYPGVFTQNFGSNITFDTEYIIKLLKNGYQK